MTGNFPEKAIATLWLALACERRGALTSTPSWRARRTWTRTARGAPPAAGAGSGNALCAWPGRLRGNPRCAACAAGAVHRAPGTPALPQGPSSPPPLVPLCPARENMHPLSGLAIPMMRGPSHSVAAKSLVQLAVTQVNNTGIQVATIFRNDMIMHFLSHHQKKLQDASGIALPDRVSAGHLDISLSVPHAQAIDQALLHIDPCPAPAQRARARPRRCHTPSAPSGARPHCLCPPAAAQLPARAPSPPRSQGRSPWPQTLHAPAGQSAAVAPDTPLRPSAAPGLGILRGKGQPSAATCNTAKGYLDSCSPRLKG